MQGLLLQVFRIAFLALIWFFIWLVIKVINQDLTTARVRNNPKTTDYSFTKTKISKKNPKYLQITKGGKLTGSRITLNNQPILIGRASDCTLVLTDDYISNHHARLIPRSSGWYLEDLGATNGTFLENSRVNNPTKVPVGAKMQLGQTVLELKS